MKAHEDAEETILTREDEELIESRLEDHDGEFIHWSAHEYLDKERSPDWYWAIGIITAAVFISAVMLNNLLFGIFALLAGLTTGLFSAKKPDLVDFEINSKGIHADRAYYPFSSLQSFWVIKDSHEPKIVIRSKKTLAPQIIIPIGDSNAGEIRKFLKQFIKEEPQDEPLPHTLMDRLGF